MEMVDLLAERFSAAPPWHDPRQAGHKAATAAQALVATAMHYQLTRLPKAIQMPRTTLIAPLAVEASASTARALLGFLFQLHMESDLLVLDLLPQYTVS